MSEAPATLFGLDPLWLATALLLATYAAVVVERVNRAIVALLGAGLMVGLGVIDQRRAVAGEDFNTLALLIGMMLLVAIARRSGMFQYLAVRTVKLGRGRPAAILALLALVSALVSALLDNVTTVLLIAPVTLVIAQELKVPPYPFLLTEILASNIGGTATLIGDPPNIIIGSAAGLSFNDFVLHLTPIVLVILAAQLAVNHLLWGRRMLVSAKDRARVMAFDEREAITDRRLLRQSLVVVLLVILGFVLARALRLEPGTIALSGAALLLLLDNWRRGTEAQSEVVHKTFADVEWVTIFFFVGLFVIVAGVEEAGLLRLFADRLAQLTRGNLTATALVILWGSAILSALIDNIPFVATMIPVIKGMAPAVGGPEQLQPLWWALSLGACLGGNGTLIGASANLTVAGIGDRAGVPFRFLPFLKTAMPMMLMSILISTIYLWLRYL
jgi:Na+/H+ antiporter NhaD/arsenite permease-like protein